MAKKTKKPPVYVGTMEFPYRRMIMFHMASPDVEELHKMADAIGIQRKWFQDPKYNGKSLHPHYDVCKSKKEKAMKLGAIEVNDRELIKLCYTELKKLMQK